MARARPTLGTSGVATARRAFARALLGATVAACGAQPATGPHALAARAAPCPEPSEPEALEQHSERELAMLLNAGDRFIAADLDAAIAKYAEALEVVPRSHEAHQRLARAYMKKEAYADAARVLAASTELFPSFADDWSLLGTARLGRADLDGAAAAFERAVAIDPRRAEAWLGLADARLRTRDDRAALVALGRAIEADPASGGAYVELADLHARLERPDDALAVAALGKAAPGASPEDVRRLHLVGARVHAERGDTALAIRELESARAIPDPPGVEAALIDFSLGAAYATSTPPRSSEARALLTTFTKRACRVQSAQRIASECEQAMDLLSRLGEAP